MKPPNILAGAGLDRLDPRRGDEDWLAARLADPASRLTFTHQARNWVEAPGGTPRLGWVPITSDGWRAAASSLVLLGEQGGRVHFAADMSEVETPEDHPLLAGGRFEELRGLAGLLSREEAGQAAYARAMAIWHGRQLYCGLCGAPTQSQQAGHRRVCTNPRCGAEHFPRTDPAVIVLVHDGADRCLLGRSPRFPPGMYSTLAGFVEPGESLEECVIREVAEEAGVTVTDITYHSSQPWPFPTSLMLGFFARATDFDVMIDTDELEDAIWVERGALKDGSSPVSVPPGISIARRLIDDWLAE